MIRFTKEEKSAILFILAVFLIGAAVFFWRKINPRPLEIFESKGVFRSEKININTAPKEELIKIKGIGPVTADKIIAYREKYGRFTQKSDLMEIKGIGESTYQKIKKKIRIE